MLKLRNKAYSIRKILDHTGAILLCVLLLLVWHVYRSPIALPFLKPYIIKALNYDDTEYQVTVDSVNLEIVRSIKPIKIIANNVVYKKNDGSIIINAPKTSVSFSIKAILRGIVAPSSIEIQKPSVYVFTSYGLSKDKPHKKEEITNRQMKYYFNSVEDFLERFNSADETYPETYVNDISIKNAEVEFHEIDLGKKWILSDLNYTFERNDSNIYTDFNALFKLQNKVSSLGLEIQYRFKDSKIAMEFYFSDLFPSDFITTFFGEQTRKKLYEVNLPINGKISGLIDLAKVLENKEQILKNLDTSLENVNFQFEGGQGNIMFSDNEEYEYDISSFVLEGNLDSGLNNLKIEDADFDLGNQKAQLSFEVSGMKKYLLEDSLDDLKLKIGAKVKELPLDELSKYWPKYIAYEAWEWCKDSIYGGKGKEAEFSFEFAYDEARRNVVFTGLSGVAFVDDSNLYYLSGMPHIKNVYGKINFYSDRLFIEIDKGISNGVIVHGGHVDLYDLNKNRNFANIKILANSSITDALKLIDHPPLNYAAKFGLEPDKLTGEAETDLTLEFELKQNLKPQEVKVNVISELSHVNIPNVFQDKSIEAEKLSLTVNNDGLFVEGKTVFDGIGLDLAWDEKFLSKDYKSKYKLSFRLTDEIKKKLNIEAGIINPPYIKGFPDIQAEIVIFNDKKTDINIYADLQNTEIDYSFLGFWKGLGEEAHVRTKLEFGDDKLKSVPSFGLFKEEFELQGKIDINDDGSIHIIDIYKVMGPKTDAKAKIEFLTVAGKPKYKINVSGNTYDLTEFFVKKEDADKKSYAKLVEQDSQIEVEEDDWLEKTPDTDVYIAVDRLWTNEEVAVGNFAGSVKLVRGIGVYEAHIVGNYGRNKDDKLTLDYTPRPNNEFLLSINSNNAGSTLKVLRVYENMRGGVLQINGKRNADKEFIGHAGIRDFNIYNTPALAKLFTVASFTGMVNLLRGDGMVFSHFDAPFEYKYKTLYIKDLKAFGNVIGITANGSYSRTREDLNISGVIVPAYSLNMMIGKIPVLGSLLSGKDGSVFAANYEMKGDIADPNININPLSALSPGSVKDMYESLFAPSTP